MSGQITANIIAGISTVIAVVAIVISVNTSNDADRVSLEKRIATLETEIKAKSSAQQLSKLETEFSLVQHHISTIGATLQVKADKTDLTPISTAMTSINATVSKLNNRISNVEVEQRNQAQIKSIPTGSIFPFAGSLTEAGRLSSYGWYICDGRPIDDIDAAPRFRNSSTPKLKDRFLMGANSIGKTGGHSGATTSSAGNHSHGRRQISGSGFGDDRPDNQFLPNHQGNHSHSVDVLPPYYTVIYLIYVR